MTQGKDVCQQRTETFVPHYKWLSCNWDYEEDSYDGSADKFEIFVLQLKEERKNIIWNNLVLPEYILPLYQPVSLCDVTTCAFSCKSVRQSSFGVTVL
jgi:hypothetical protein